MDEATFWAVIDDARREAEADLDVDRGAVADLLAEGVTDRLARLPAADIVAFDGLVTAKRRAARTWPLWAAGYLLCGGCSDDGFEYFRLWLISRGRAVYEAAVADPDSLAALADPDADGEAYECEPLMSAAGEAHQRAFGTPLPDRVEIEPLNEPAGERWDFDDDAAMAARLPRLAAIYFDDDHD